MSAFLKTSFVLLISCICAPAWSLNILEVTPGSLSLSAASNSSISARFDASIDTASCDLNTFQVFGHWSGVLKGSFVFEESNTVVRFIPATTFNSGEWVLVSLSRHIRSETGDSLSRGFAWQFWIKPTPGNIELHEIDRISVRASGEGHIQTYGAHGADLNEDGFSDFFVPNENTNDCRVFLNDGSGHYSSFEIFSIENGSRPSTNEGADFNHDGHIDMAVGNSTNDKVTVFTGNGQGGFESIINYQADSGVRGLAIADFDGDSYMDIVTANRTGSNLAILLNNGDNTFGPRSIIDANSNNETACAIADANNDGIMDLFVGAFGSHEISLLLGDGQGGFVFASKVSAGGNGPWMIATGDLNGDGYADAATANAQSSSVGIVFGDGEGGLSEATSYQTSGFPIAIDFGDIDGDEDLDLMTSNYSGGNWTYWENDGTGVMINRRSLSASSAGSCATFHDRDNDGDLDMTGIDEVDDLIILFENTGSSATTQMDVSNDFSLNAMPNPFSTETSIGFTIPVSLAHQTVSIHISGSNGAYVSTLLQKILSPGQHTIQYNPESLTAGIYTCTLECGIYLESIQLRID